MIHGGVTMLMLMSVLLVLVPNAIRLRVVLELVLDYDMWALDDIVDLEDVDVDEDVDILIPLPFFLTLSSW
eukprot:CAMPEP_0170949834 /NCGR_PEP_ID=MMETSP0735-20130129/29536_1 /TAXON_ID=186038 /ORGANISM="Fragilariopsis kerguelensis, Strain L26-C5" /LENGTH=70 /DNA_ID=CAMNT_0011360023 /DNA_START=80 /DNA_END=292 /DNA_ORIENTATION=-